MTDIDTFLSDLASDAPVPGGGSVAALETAMAASLLAMVANLTIGRKRYSEVQDQVLTIRQRADELRSESRRLVDADSQAYGAVSVAMSLPKDTDEARSARTAQIQEALKAAAGPPLQTMRVASEIIELARQLVDIGNRSAVSDVGTAAVTALAGFEAARLNVEINRALVRDADWATATEQDLAAIPPPQRSVAEVMTRAESIIRGNA